jgi:hypothetical protein
MKKMKTSLAIAVALATGVGTSVFAQVVKQDTITFNLSGQEQSSVSDTTAANAGTFSAGPLYYKTANIKLTDKDVIKYIGFTAHGAAGYYGTKASLVLVQAELSGFFNITPDLGLSEADFDMDGSFASDDTDPSTAIANSTDSSYVQLSNGRHLLVNPVVTSEYPVGHLQPWGQIYVQYTSSSGTLLCENVTYFFALSVQECYDCFYLNSFISDATFKVQTTSQVGPPCCGTSSTLVGKGKDRYYLTLSFDDTINNPYLDPRSSTYVGVTGADFVKATIPSDGINPDTIPYSDVIKSGIGTYTPYVARFTLNGILTYSWNLQFFNKSDISPDFIGTGAYAANGYGFIALYCNLFTGTATFTEKLVKEGACCTGESWSDWWYGVGAEYINTESGVETMYWFDNYPTPFNVSTSLAYHENFDATYPYNAGNFAPAAWPSPAITSQFWVPFTSGY